MTSNLIHILGICLHEILKFQQFVYIFVSGNGGYFDTKDKGAPPPLVTTNFVTRDYGNASPRFMRSTMYYVPSSEDMRKQTGKNQFFNTLWSLLII